MKHIGIVACSAEGAALCFRTLCAEDGRQDHPEISLHCHPLETYMRRIRSNRWQGVGELMLSSARKLNRAGADFVICPDNTIHRVFDRVAKRSPLPWLHIAEIVAAEAKRRGFRRLAILGTRYLMEGPVYPSRLTPLGIEHRIPPLQDRIRINRIIFEELVNGVFSIEARRYFGSVIRQVRRRGCDAVVLGCTEIPLLISQEHSELPILDSTRLLARAALSFAHHDAVPVAIGASL